PAPTILLAPLFVFGTMICAAGAGLLLAALIVAYRDFRYVITFLVQIWLFATPVLYALTIVPVRWRMLYSLNPMVGMVTGFRPAILGGSLPLDLMLISLVGSAVLLLVGVRYFVQVERRFADVI